MKPKKGIHILPSLFTTGNVFCGFYAFVAVLNENFYYAAWAIVIGMIFDGLDGRIARLTKTTSAFAMQYDSLADIITFAGKSLVTSKLLLNLVGIGVNKHQKFLQSALTLPTSIFGPRPFFADVK